MSGLLLGIVRMTEPVFYRHVSTLLRKTILCRKINEQESSKNQSTMLQFLMSSLNIELVHIILTAVSQKTVGTPKHDSDFLVYQNYDFNNKNEFVIDYIEINDRKEWDIEVVLTNDNQPSLVS